MWASLNGHVEVVDRLIQHGATVDLQEKVRTVYYMPFHKLILTFFTAFDITLHTVQHGDHNVYKYYK